jgi:hypothetical protein
MDSSLHQNDGDHPRNEIMDPMAGDHWAGRAELKSAGRIAPTLVFMPVATRRW